MKLPPKFSGQPIRIWTAFANYAANGAVFIARSVLPNADEMVA
jgi:hypothetical protein